jgi:hypothetical protein
MIDAEREKREDVKRTRIGKSGCDEGKERMTFKQRFLQLRRRRG